MSCLNIWLQKRLVQPLVVVDNSAFSPSRLTAPLTLPILAAQGSSPCFHFQLRGF